MGDGCFMSYRQLGSFFMAITSFDVFSLDKNVFGFVQVWVIISVK